MLDQMMPPGGPPGAPPPMMPPGGPPMGPPEEPELPKRAKVVKVEGQTVFLSTDDGQELKVPIESFIFPPEVGAELVQAQVLGVEGEMMMIMVEGQEVEVPATEGFAEGDYFWMPAPPMGPAEEMPMGGEGQEQIF